MKSLEEKAQDILEKAESMGVQSNFLFKTTFNRYTVQLKIMQELEKEIKEIGATVQKEYVKGRKNVYTNPAITEYNRTASAANNTVATLINIIKSLEKEDRTESGDPLAALLKEVNG